MATKRNISLEEFVGECDDTHPSMGASAAKWSSRLCSVAEPELRPEGRLQQIADG